MSQLNPPTHSEPQGERTSASEVDSQTSPTNNQRTLNEVRDQIAQELAVRAISKAETVNGIVVGVVMTLSQTGGAGFVLLVSTAIKRILLLRQHIFAIATTGAPSQLVICGSSPELLQKATLLATSKFLGRIETELVDGDQWVANVKELGATSFDKLALWDVVRKSTWGPTEPSAPPPGSRGIDQILSDVRAKLQRVTPLQAYQEIKEPTNDIPVLLIDIRYEAQREAEGIIIGSLKIERNVLEWRLDPRNDARLPIADRYDLRVIIFCQEGYTSSLAAHALHEIGLLNATDVIGGFAAWKEAGLPLRVNPNSTPTGSVNNTLSTHARSTTSTSRRDTKMEA